MEAALRFPPFPQNSHVTDQEVVSFADWETNGIWTPDSHTPDGNRRSHDAHLIPLIDLDVGHNPNDPEKDARREQERLERLRERQRISGGMPMRLQRADCLVIGSKDSNWIEPDETTRSTFNEAEPPFSRLITATRDFLYSRHEELQFLRSKRLFDLMRNVLGIRTEYAGPHWPGAHGEPYQGPSRPQLGLADSAYTGDAADEQEVCVLLRNPITSVRGFLALARREAEADWNVEPAVNLARITSAFLAFLVAHQVFTESPLRQGIKEASDLARSAPHRILQAKELEDELASRTGINAALWNAFAVEKSPQSHQVQTIAADAGDSKEEDHGGWCLPNSNEVQHAHERIDPIELLHSLFPEVCDFRTVGKMVEYQRRKVIRVERYDGPESVLGGFMRLVTAAAPWTAEECWRIHRPCITDVDGSRIVEPGSPLANPLEDLPAEIPILIPTACGSVHSPEAFVGCGLRGSFGCLVRHGQPDLWMFKIKDYVLPSFWQST